MEADILKPAKNLRMNEEEEHEYDLGLVFERCPEILIRGHHVYLSSRVENIACRAKFSNYIFMPTKFNFRKVVRVTALMFKYIRNTKIGVWPKSDSKFKMFVVQKTGNNLVRKEEKSFDFFVNDDKFADICWGSENNLMRSTGEVFVDLTDDDISLALEYWYKKGTLEVKQFNKSELVSRVAVERNGILFSRSRIMEGQRFIMTSEFDEDSVGQEVQLDLMTPVLDRYSSISYSIASFIHHEVGKHAGSETCYRLSLSFCHILQGAGLFREIGEECAKCAMIRKKFIDVVMGPVSDHQLTISPPFYAAYCDLDGPYTVYVPGFERETRARKTMSTKAWIMSFACPVTKLVNLQVIESKSADGVLEGLTRLGCECGFPKFVLLDQESSFMKAVRDAEISLKDLQLCAYKEHGIRCKVAPVSGHNFHGLI